MRMLRYVFVCLILFSSWAVSAGNDELKVVLHVNDDFKIAYLDKSVKNIRNELGDDIEIQVVINGKAVTRLLRSNKRSTRIVQNVLKLNAPIGLCHNALANNNLMPDMLIEGLDVLKTDGNVTVINYQAKGYYYIKL